MIIVGDNTGDHRFPSTSNIICDKSGATNAWGFDQVLLVRALYILL